jgi:type IV pilus assembly protein PilM
MLDLFTLKPESFGLDISDLSLKIIKLKRKSDFLSLVSFGEAKIKPGIIEGGEIKDGGALAGIIKEALGQVRGEKLNTKYVIASLPEEKAFLQVIQLPLMAEAEARKAAYFEAENYIPLPIDKVYFDAQAVPAISQEPDHHSDVLIAALPKSILDPYASVLKNSGLKPLALEIESQAISRALIKEGETDFPVLIIDLGATRIGFMVFSGRSLRFTSSKPISSLKSGLALNDLTEQIQKYINYYKTHAAHEHLPASHRGASISKILLCGGGANLEGLVDFLSSKLNLLVELGNPWVNILPKPLSLPHRESLRYATALGLALRGFYKYAY